jgi:hypothetical protein
MLTRGSSAWPDVRTFATRLYLGNEARTSPLPGRRGPFALFAALGTDFGTERGESDGNDREVVKQTGRLNAAELDI